MTLQQQHQQNQESATSEFAEMLRQLGNNMNALTEVGKTQSELSKKQVEAIATSKGPRPVQPVFKPVGNVQDYLSYKTF